MEGGAFQVSRCSCSEAPFGGANALEHVRQPHI
jgi:hypothetical protein